MFSLLHQTDIFFLYISTGQAVSPEFTKSLGQFTDVAKQKNAEFVERRLFEGKKKQSFWDAVNHTKTLTFAAMSKNVVEIEASKFSDGCLQFQNKETKT